MDHKFGFEVAGTCHDCLAGWKLADLGDDFLALFEDCGTTDLVNGAIHPTNTHKCGISGVDYRVGCLVGDVALEERYDYVVDLGFHMSFLLVHTYFIYNLARLISCPKTETSVLFVKSSSESVNQRPPLCKAKITLVIHFWIYKLPVTMLRLSKAQGY